MAPSEQADVEFEELEELDDDDLLNFNSADDDDDIVEMDDESLSMAGTDSDDEDDEMGNDVRNTPKRVYPQKRNRQWQKRCL